MNALSIAKSLFPVTTPSKLHGVLSEHQLLTILLPPLLPTKPQIYTAPSTTLWPKDKAQQERYGVDSGLFSHLFFFCISLQ